MRYGFAIFTNPALAAAAPAQGKSEERAPRYKLQMRVAKPKLPKNWGKDPRRPQDTVGGDRRTDFAGRCFLAVVGRASACVWGAIVEPKSGRMIRVPFVSSGTRRTTSPRAPCIDNSPINYGTE